MDAYEHVQSNALEITDDVAAFQTLGKEVSLVMSTQNNLKITNPEDVELANFLVHTGAIKKVFELAYQ
jgi:2-C-methyl-D-erythritol 4-phosphate cytidylyltransferase